MLDFTSSTSTPSPAPYNAKRHLARLRRIAKRRGFKVLGDWSGFWSLVDTRIEPPQALLGLFQVSLNEIGVVLSTPLPPPKTRKPKVKAETAQPPSPQIVDVESAPVKSEPAEPLSNPEALVDAIFEKLARGR